jgi:hypothetical protein
MTDLIASGSIAMLLFAAVIAILWLLMPLAVFAINSKITAACADLRRIRALIESHDSVHD